jgi:hypothetical protein
MEPLAQYREERFGGPRHYTLYPGYLMVSGRETFRSEFEVKVPLRNLQPEHSLARVRNHLFWVALLLAVVGALGVLERLSSPAGLTYDDFWSVLWVALVAAGTVIAMATWRKVAYAIFVDDRGRGVIGFLDRDEGQFRMFLRMLSEQIVASKTS